MHGDANDFPAAHSMDTDWFAVDADGHVGLFSSGEGGAVPETFGAGQDVAWDFVRQLAVDAPAVLWRNGSVQGRHCLAPDRARGDHAFCVVAFLRHPPAWPPSRRNVDVAFSEPFPTPDGPVYAAFAEMVDDDHYDQLHRDGACLGCACQRHGRLAHLGLFAFDCDEQEADPYQRVGVPETPLNAADLPPGVRSAVERNRLPNVRFSRAERVQPLEHMACFTWGPIESYLASDGVTQVPMPDPESGGD